MSSGVQKSVVDGRVRRFFFSLVFIPILSGCGFVFAKSPPVGWQSSDDLETIALTQPCTNSKTLVAIDGALAGLQVLAGVAYLSLDELLYPEKNTYAAGSFIASGVLVAGAISGNGKVAECRAFNAALLEQRRAQDFDQVIHEGPASESGENYFGSVYEGAVLSTSPAHLPSSPSLFSPTITPDRR